MKKFLEKLNKKKDLSFEESKSAFNILMNGEATDDEIKAAISHTLSLRPRTFKATIELTPAPIAMSK